MAVFHIHPHNYLVGAWIALEDVSLEAGPLEYYPGSHRSKMFPEFKDYPQDNLRTCSGEADTRYHDHVKKESSAYERKFFEAKKGDVLLWHGMLFHGGATIINPELTRKSYVVHFIPSFADRTKEVKGPFNWV